MAAAKTNALRLIATLGIDVTTADYPVGDEHVDAVTVAKTLGVDPDRVWKTLVARDDKGAPLVFCIPGPSELDLKKAARAAGVRSVALLPLRDLTAVTGYVRGGCSPIGMKKAFPTWLDEMALAYETIYVNAGARGLQMIIAPGDLLRASGASVADLV